MAEEAQHNNSDPPLGQVLKNARIAQGLTLEDIAKTLRIGIRSLALLEEDDDLVCDVYTLGFLRSYARHLGLNENELCQKFKERAGQIKQPLLVFPAPTRGKGMPSFTLLGLSFVALLALIGGWTWWEYNNVRPSAYDKISVLEASATLEEKTEQSDPPQEDLLLTEIPSNEESSLETTGLDETPLLDFPPPITPAAVVLKATEDAWIEVRDKDGQVIMSRLFKPGEEHEFKDPALLLLKTGNARGVKLTSQGKTLELLGSAGEVKANIPLDPEKWVDQTPKTH